MGEPAAKPAPFIVGVGRSGTTLLRLMLDAHPDLAIPSETHFLPSIIARLRGRPTRAEFLRIVTGADTWPNFGLAAEALKRALNEVEPFTAAEAIRCFYRLYAGLFGKARWGDKTPPYRTHMVAIGQLLPEARFIHVIRDGRDVALSYRGLWFGPGDDIRAQARFWVGQVLSARSQSAKLRHYMEVRYEALVTDPESVLKAVSEYLDLPYHPRMLDFHGFAAARLGEIKQPFGPAGAAPAIERFLAIHERTRNPPERSRIGRWRSEMTASEQRQYESIAGELLRDLGYETADS